MKVLICGSRDWTNAALIREVLSVFPLGTVVIHGAARGADQQAGQAADELGFEQRMGYLRNIEDCDLLPNLVLAFQRNGSKGTQHTIDQARRRGIPVEVHSG